MTDTIADLKRQLLQLDDLRRSGALPEAAAASARSELERRLVDAVLAGGPTLEPNTDSNAAAEARAQAERAGAKPSRRLQAGLLLFVVVFGIAGYWWRGAPGGWQTGPGANPATDTEVGAAAAPAEAASSAHSMNMAQIEAMMASLVERLKANPQDTDGWLMLGRSWSVLGRYEDAIPAFRKVLALQPANAQALADLADALAMSQGRSFAGEPTRLVGEALKADPDNLKALALAGTLAFEGKDYKTAVKHWERAIALGPADSDLLRQIRDNVAEARQLAGLPPAAAATTVSPPAAIQAQTQTTAPAAAGAGRVGGRVELSPALAAKAQPDDTVFIFARPASGARMPLAILKRRVRDLPLDFSLDDSLAMSPAAVLSKAASVVVGARISRSGQAMPQPGDLQGLSAPVSPGSADSQRLRIVITDEVH